MSKEKVQPPEYGFKDEFIPDKDHPYFPSFGQRKAEIEEHTKYCYRCKNLTKRYKPTNKYGVYKFYEKAGEYCLYFLCRYILYRNEEFKMLPETHYDLCEFIWHWDFENKRTQQKKLVMMPRYSYKTGIISTGYVLQQIIHNTNIKILIDSHTLGYSIWILNGIKTQISMNKMFRQHYGDLKPTLKEDNRKWAESAIRITSDRNKKLFCSRMDKDPTILCSGVDSPKTGMHPHLLICDDLHNETNIQKKEQIDKVINHYKLMHAVLDPSGWAIAVGTRWSNWDVLKWIEDKEKNLKKFVRSAYNADGSLFFPTKLNADFLEDQKEMLGAYFFSCQYLNDPRSPDDEKFKPQWFIRSALPYELSAPIGTVIDPATGEGKDRTGIVTGCYDKQKAKLYILEAKSVNVNETQLAYELLDTVIRFKPRKVGMEAFAFQKTYQYSLQRILSQMGHTIRMDALPTDTQMSKKFRIARLVPFYERGDIIHVGDCAELEKQLSWFRMEADTYLDDLIDAESYLLDLLSVPFRFVNVGVDFEYSQKKHTAWSSGKQESRIPKIINPEDFGKFAGNFKIAPRKNMDFGRKQKTHPSFFKPCWYSK